MPGLTQLVADDVGNGASAAYSCARTRGYRCGTVVRSPLTSSEKIQAAILEYPDVESAVMADSTYALQVRRGHSRCVSTHAGRSTTSTTRSWGQTGGTSSTVPLSQRRRLPDRSSASSGWCAARLSVKFLPWQVDAGCDVTATDDVSNTALHFACANGHDQIVERILKIAPQCVDAQAFSANTPLHMAAMNGHYAAAKVDAFGAASCDCCAAPC